MDTSILLRHWPLAFGATLLVLALALGLRFSTNAYVTVALWQLIAVVLGVVGAVFATDAWVQRVQAGGSTVWIIAGALCLAIGSIVSTLGWNGLSDWKQQKAEEQDAVQQRNAALRIVAADLKINFAILNNRSFMAQNEEQLTQPALFPRVQTTALTSAIDSGLFVSKEYEALFQQLFRTRLAFEELNWKADWAERMLTAPLKDRENSAPVLRKLIRDSPRNRAVDACRSLGNLLKKDFNIDWNESSLLMSDEIGVSSEPKSQ